MEQLVEQILELVRESFSEHVSSSASETVLGLESHLEGTEDWEKDLREKLFDILTTVVCNEFEVGRSSPTKLCLRHICSR